jgi:hypothetical protein
MAANPPPPPDPAQVTTVHYRDYFADASKDVYNGEYTALLAPYSVPAANAMLPAEVRNLAVNCRAQNIPTAFVLLHNDDNLLHTYVQLDKFHTRAGLPHTPWDERMFIAKGDLHHNNHVTVEFVNQYFNQTNNIAVPSPAMIDTAYAAGADANLLGPYNAVADAGVESIRVRRTCIIPMPYVPLLLARPLSPREAWDIVRSQIITDNRETACKPFIDFLRCAITISNAGDASPSLAVNPPIAPLPDVILLDRRRAIIENDFPSLNANLQGIQQHQIAGQLGLLVTESRAAREADSARRVLEKNKPPAQYLGPIGTLRLLRYCQVENSNHFPPFWIEIARNPKFQHLNILQWEINRFKEQLNEPDLQFLATAPLLEVSKSLMWEMTNTDAVTTGLNVFILAEQSIEDAMNKQQMYEMLHGDGASPSMSDAAALLKSKAGAPTMLYHARQQVRRLEIIVKVLMGENHPVAVQLNAFCNKMISNEGRLHILQADTILLPTFLCKKITIQMSNWFKKQVSQPTAVQAPNFAKVFDDIDEEKQWKPTLSTAFLSALNLSTFHEPPARRTPFLPTPSPSPAPAPTPAPAPAPSPSPRGRNNPSPNEAVSERINNRYFNAELFSKYKDSPMSCRILRLRIRNNEVPALPKSKVDNNDICIAWHCKSMCNVNCGRKADHVQYTEEEYAPLIEWCAANFPVE